MKLLPIILVLLGYQNEISISSVNNEIYAMYGSRVEVAYAPLPKNAYYKPNKRYRADVLLDSLVKMYPNKRIVAITSSDISCTSNGIYDWGIFGLGSLSKNVCITSTYRLKNHNLKHRLTNVVLHEIGHTYGLEHCTSFYPCLMKAGNQTAKCIDKEPKALCINCLNKLKIVDKKLGKSE